MVHLFRLGAWLWFMKQFFFLRLPMFPFPSSLAKLQADAVVKARLDGKALRVPWLAGDLSLKVIFP